MNLIAYDKLNSVDKQKTWINVYSKAIFSKEIRFRNYSSIGKRYDKELENTIYYIIVTDDKPVDRPSSKVLLGGNGSIKINVKDLFEEINFAKYNTNYVNIDIKHTEHSDDGDIYEMNILT